jgi:hypothetical protein
LLAEFHAMSPASVAACPPYEALVCFRLGFLVDRGADVGAAFGSVLTSSLAVLVWFPCMATGGRQSMYLQVCAATVRSWGI